MRKRMLRSVIVAAFSALVAFGTLAGYADGSRSAAVTKTVSADDSGTVYTPNDSSWA
ncbi:MULTISPECIES: hypothetical protein [unclassified Streptomyces]|uniref:hypothetical protein n=1 Tax=unclassified Streptomyces TaxID=2593676 RepID=UPI00137CA3DD|nr:hypothetical protein [Streptomyces sp. SID4985]MYQ44228.1 hypothetical protein [Streptomyces sp. SID4985]